MGDMGDGMSTGGGSSFSRKNRSLRSNKKGGSKRGGGGGAPSASDLEKRTARSATTRGSGIMNRRLLSDEVESTQRLVSHSGKDRIAGQYKQRYLEAALGNGQGAAFALSRYCGHLEPWGVMFVELTCHNDRFGVYDDELVCEMTDSSGTQEVRFPVHTQPKR